MPRKPKKRERPKLREVKVLVPGDGINAKPVERRGKDLDSVFAAIVYDIKERTGWSDEETAAHLALGSRSNVQQILTGRGTSLEVLSSFCAATRMTPVAAFQSHEAYRPENSEAIAFADDHIYDQIRAVLDPDEAKRVIPALRRVKSRGALEALMSAIEQLLSHGQRQEKSKVPEKAAE